MNRVSLKVPSDPKFLSLVRKVVGKAAELAGFDEKDVCQVQLAITEACSNIIRHSYKNDYSQEIEIEVAIGDEGISMIVKDQGESAGNSILEPIEKVELTPGGLGVNLIHKCMNEVDYERVNDHTNRLCMVKRLNSGSR